MTADVEPEPFVLDCLGESADPFVRFDDQDRHTELRELEGGGQPGGSGANYHHRNRRGGLAYYRVASSDHGVVAARRELWMRCDRETEVASAKQATCRFENREERRQRRINGLGVGLRPRLKYVEWL